MTPKSTISKLGEVTSASVEKHTKKSWDRWIPILEKAGARAMEHAELVEFLANKHKLSPWWRQIVAMCFEIYSGKRIPGQNLKGKYTLTSTKALACDVKAAWLFILAEEGQRLWLNPLFPVTLIPGNHFETRDGIFGEVRTMKIARRLRMSWQDPDFEKATVLQLHFVPRPKGRCLVVFSHEGLVTARYKSALKEKWKKALQDIAEAIES
ncbi:MAG: hypothetical protein ABIR96_05395 [Bdellovibrionota bacterium]